MHQLFNRPLLDYSDAVLDNCSDKSKQFHARIQEFSSGGGGGGCPGSRQVSLQSDKKKKKKKKALTDNVFFFFFFFFSPQLILQKSNGQFQTNLSFFKVQEGVQHFPGGGGGGSNFFQGGGPIAYSL